MPEKTKKNSAPAARAAPPHDGHEEQGQASPAVAVAGTETPRSGATKVADQAPAEDGSHSIENAAAVTEARLKQQEVVSLPDFSHMLAEAAAGSIEMLNDVDLDVKIELGRTELTIDEILQLSEGSVVELDKLAGDPVDILVNEQLIARGEVLVVNDNFCVRINEIIPGVSEKAS